MPNDLRDFLFSPSRPLADGVLDMLQNDFPQLATALPINPEAQSGKCYLIPSEGVGGLGQYGYDCTLDSILNVGLGYSSDASKDALRRSLLHMAPWVNRAFICSYLHKLSDPHMRRLRESIFFTPVSKPESSRGEVFEIISDNVVDLGRVFREWPRIGGRGGILVFWAANSHCESILYVVIPAFDGEGFLICSFE